MISVLLKFPGDHPVRELATESLAQHQRHQIADASTAPRHAPI